MSAPVDSTSSRWLVRAIAISIWAAYSATNIAQASPPSPQVSGSLASKNDQSQRGDTFVLKAHLVPRAKSASAPVQEGGAFSMIGKLVSTPTVCYGDTIFRDDFDGDGF
ncbi:MAG: hypothetical protein ABIS07_01720 [Dokdonella sp.]